MNILKIQSLSHRQRSLRAYWWIYYGLVTMISFRLSTINIFEIFCYKIVKKIWFKTSRIRPDRTKTYSMRSNYPNCWLIRTMSCLVKQYFYFIRVALFFLRNHISYFIFTAMFVRCKLDVTADYKKLCTAL